MEQFVAQLNRLITNDFRCLFHILGKLIKRFLKYLLYIVEYHLILYGTICSPVIWGYRIYQLHLCRGVRSPPSTRVLDMTLNNLTERLQFWSFGECGVSLHCYYSQVHSDQIYVSFSTQTALISLSKRVRVKFIAWGIPFEEECEQSWICCHYSSGRVTSWAGPHIKLILYHTSKPWSSKNLILLLCAHLFLTSEAPVLELERVWNPLFVDITSRSILSQS